MFGIGSMGWNWLNGWNGCSINAIDELGPNAMPIVFLFKIIAASDEDLELISARAKIIRGHNAKGMVVLRRQIRKLGMSQTVKRDTISGEPGWNLANCNRVRNSENRMIGQSRTNTRDFLYNAYKGSSVVTLKKKAFLVRRFMLIVLKVIL